MHTYKPIKLPMDYTTRNHILLLLHEKLCNWGFKKTIMTNDGKIIGAPSPLWTNPSSFFYKVFSILTLLCFILFIGCYIFLRFYNNDQQLTSILTTYGSLSTNISKGDFVAQAQPSQTYTVDEAYCMFISFKKINTVFVIIGAILLFFNFLHTMYLGCILDYASDIEWSRLLFINLFIWVLMSGFIIGDLIYSSELINYYNKNYSATSTTTSIFSSSTSKCNNLFQANMYGYLIVGIIMALLAVFQIVKIIQLKNNFFFKNFVEHSARCEDENIIVVS